MHEQAANPGSGEKSALDQLVERVNNIAESAIGIHQVLAGIGAMNPDDSSDRALVAALSYYGSRDRRGREFFGPWEGTEEDLFPPPLAIVPYDMTQVWEEFANRVTSPLIKARLHDLCFTTRTGWTIDHAQAAIKSYIDLAERYSRGWEREDERLHLSVGASLYIARATDLARQVHQKDLIALAYSSAISLTRFAFDDPNSGPGVTLGLLAPLVSNRSCPEEVDELLHLARERYADDVWNTMSTIALQVERAREHEVRTALIGEQVTALLVAADRAEPIGAILHLRQAEDISNRHGLVDLNRTIRLRLQKLRGTDLGLSRVANDVSLDRQTIDNWIGKLRGEATWQIALTGLLSSVAPTGSVSTNRALAAEMPKIAPLQTMLPTLHVSPDGSIEGSAAGNDPDDILSKIEIQQFQILGPVLAYGLRNILDQFGPIDETEAMAVFGANPQVPPMVAECLAKALTRHTSGDYEGVAYTVLPRIERLMRESLALLGEPITRPGFGGSIRGHIGIWDMITTLEERGLDPSWARFFRNFLVGRLNVRNDGLHGNFGVVNESLSALVIVAAVYFALLGFKGDDPSPTDLVSIQDHFSRER